MIRQYLIVDNSELTSLRSQIRYPYTLRIHPTEMDGNLNGISLKLPTKRNAVLGVMKTCRVGEERLNPLEFKHLPFI